ncbi:hypothetical protein DPV78_004645 [Talaromyces pinophilus]|nr:hypothetical protein DPV78_004645 [Talaromyces pinophilus]
MPPSQFFDLLNALSSLDVDKFRPFETVTTQYKYLERSSSGITTDILIPKRLVESKSYANCPILVRIHGGFLVTGSSRYAPWFSTWILNFALENEAIIVSPNYRLLPEATGEDILEDMNDFWKWLHEGGLTQSISSAGHAFIDPDLDRILMLGESAGGYLAIQLALSHPGHIQGVVAAYPMLDLKAPFYTERYSKPIVQVPNLPNTLIDEYFATSRVKEVPTVHVTAADPPDRLELAFAIVQNGRLLEFLGNKSPDLFPLERVRKLAAASNEQLSSLPPFFIFHGEQDSAVPVDGSRRFASLLQETLPDVNVRLYIQDGDHGFDEDATMETPWLREGLAMISRRWINPLINRRSRV